MIKKSKLLMKTSLGLILARKSQRNKNKIKNMYKTKTDSKIISINSKRFKTCSTQLKLTKKLIHLTSHLSKNHPGKKKINNPHGNLNSYE